MAENNPGINSTLDERRERKAAESLSNEAINRMTDLTVAQAEIWQKYVAFMATAAHYVGDTFNAFSHSLQQLASDQQKRMNEQRRGG